MSDKSLELKLCPKCGSIEYLEDYPAPGTSICAFCSHEIVTITLRETAENFSMKHKCPFCGKEGNREDILYVANNITVYKCKGCEKLDGRWEVDQAGDSDEYFKDGLYGHKSVAIAEKEGSPIYPASKAKELAKALRATEKDPEEKRKKELAELIHEKRQKMQQIGVESQTIERAIREMSFFVEREEGKGFLTKKQLESLFSGAVTLAQEDLVRMGKFKGKRITERQMEEIFNTDRKTTRKWKKVLKENRKPFKFKIWARQSEDQIEDSKAEIPTEIKSFAKLEKPHKEYCDFCGQIKLLTRRINYANSSWSDICEDSYETLKTWSLEHEWKIEALFTN